MLVLIIAGGAAGLSYSERSLPKGERRYQRLAAGIVFGAIAAIVLNWINEVPIILQLFFVFIGALFGLRSKQNQ
jgi:ABC-type amino acid transport system permease subunit